MAFSKRHIQLKMEIYNWVQEEEGKKYLYRERRGWDSASVLVLKFLAAGVKREETQLHKSQYQKGGNTRVIVKLMFYNNLNKNCRT